ncbi:PTS transporter subunit EIIC [Spiroplasma alleghenense]|uniref:PTS system, trehalose-specific IIBC component n=1 Tax=Spiroplasma alleghenense TaxID=216931 RepID=A0A345Z515_9MOLU|nr:PTS transporter subunit EIIC [Spiroplasma alleghenense]AXK51694.1 PTS system, trehalose-specific IIBC component [Spiroplasma alleghenense]
MSKKIPNLDLSDEFFAKLLELIGGKENIVSATHCLSRLRLVLANPKKADIKEIEKLSGVKGVFNANGQFQIVFGTEVERVYKAFIKYTGLKEMSKEEIKDAVVNKASWFQKALNHMSEIFIPIIPVLVAGGLILGIRNIFEAVFDPNYFGGQYDALGNPILGWSMVNVSQFINGLNAFLWIPAQVCFWWIPVHVCWSIFKKMKADEILGIVIGLTLLVPPLLNVYEVFSQGFDSIWIWDIVATLKENGQDVTFNFGFMQYPWKIAYTAQVIPAIAIGVLGAYINLYMKKVTPGAVKQIVVPLVTILASFTIAMFIIGPAGYIVGSLIGAGFQWALTDGIAKYFFAIIIGGMHATLVLTGVHHLLNAVMIQNVASSGGDFIFLSIVSQSIAQGAAVLGWMIVNWKKNENVKEVGASALTSAWLAVTEPAMYAVNLKYMYPFVAASIGAAVGLEICVVAGVSANSIGNGAWLGILSVQIQSGINGVTTWPGTAFTWFMIAGLTNTALTIVLTIAFSKIKYFQKFDLEFAAADALIETSTKTKKKDNKNIENVKSQELKNV